MQAGRATYGWEKWRMKLRVRSSGSYSGAGRAGGGFGSIYTSFTPDNENTNRGFELSILAQTGTGSNPLTAVKTEYRLQVPSMAIDTTISHTTFDTDATMELVFYGLLPYGQNGFVWKSYCDSWEWYINGSLQQTFGGFNVDTNYFTPSSIPYFGIDPTITAHGIIQPVPVVGPVSGTLTAGTATGVGRATGGWEFYEGGQWRAHPVAVSFLAAPALTCAASPGIGSATATNTGNADLSAQSSFVVTTSTRTTEITTAELTMLPNLTRGVGRMNPDYRALLRRGGFPYARQHAYRSCEFINLEGESTPVNVIAENEYFQSYSAFQSVVGNDYHIIEEPMTRTIYAPGAITGTKIYCTTAGVTTGMIGSTVGREVQTRGGSGGNSQMLPWLSHDYNSIARYKNYCAHPHWSYALDFPRDVDDTHPVTAYNWPVDGSTVNPSNYWVPGRTQWLWAPLLPAEEKYRTRNSIVFEPLNEGKYGFLVGSYNLGYGISSFWGNSRWIAQNLNTPESVTFNANNATQWNLSGCTGAFAADRVVLAADSGVTAFNARLTVAQWYRAPFQAPLLRGRVTLNWLPANVATVKVYQVSQTGQRVLLTDNVTGTYARKAAADTKYAGSWAQDYGMAGAVSDAGADTTVAGISSTVMADPELVHSFELLPIRGITYLDFEITLTAPSLAMTLFYPTFSLSTLDPVIVQEQGHHANILYPAGPGMRWGHHLWLDVDPTHLRELPDIYPIGTTPLGWKTSVLDALCWKRVYVHGVDRSTNLATEIRSLYDNLELIGTFTNPSNNNQIYRECDDSSIGVITTPGRAGTIHLVNSCAEYPPLASWPMRGRDSNWQPTGDYCQVAWSLIQGPRYYVSNAKPLELKNGSDVWTTGATGVPSGWNITTHNREVTNSEGDVFKVRWGGADKATASPYWGYFASTDVETKNTRGGIWINHTGSDKLLRGHIADGDLVLTRFLFATAAGGIDITGPVTTYGDVNFASFVMERSSATRILILLDRTVLSNQEIWLGYSDDDGVSAHSFAKLADGIRAMPAVSHQNDQLTVYFKYNSGTSGPGKLYGRYRSRGDYSFGSEFALLDTAGANITVANEVGFSNLAKAREGADRWVISLLINGDTAVSEWESSDTGTTWKRI
jgi:hypothetical protein